MNEIIQQRVYNLVNQWPLRYSNPQWPIDFSQKCTSIGFSGFTRLALNINPGSQFHFNQAIRDLLRLLSPPNCHIVDIADHSLDLIQKQWVRGFLGEEVYPTTIWLAFSQPRNILTAVVFVEDYGPEMRVVHARMLSTPLERDLISTLMDQRLDSRNVLKTFIFVLRDFKGLLEAPSIHTQYHYFDVVYTPSAAGTSGHYLTYVNDQALWPLILPAVAQSVGFRLIHLPAPPTSEIQRIRTHINEQIYCVFRLETGDLLRDCLIVVTSDLRNRRNDTRQYNASRRIFHKIPLQGPLGISYHPQYY